MATMNAAKIAELLAAARAKAAAAKLALQLPTSIEGRQVAHSSELVVSSVDTGRVETKLQEPEVEQQSLQTTVDSMTIEMDKLISAIVNQGIRCAPIDLDRFTVEERSRYYRAEQEADRLATIEDPLQHIYTTAMGKEVTLNAAQLEYVDKIKAGLDVVLIGKAGTGKTTAAGVGMTELIKAGKITPMRTSTKHLQAGLPGVAIVSFTNKAVNNIRHQMPADLKPHCVTVHKLLEFKPNYYEILDETTGDYKKTMRFEPSRNAYNPLPSDLRMIVFEESSMISVELHQMLKDALQHDCQLIYLGDIRQLPPVMGTAILGFKMIELPVVELTEVYRQALLSPILRCALSIDNGEVEKFSSANRVKAASGKWEWPDLMAWNEIGEHGSLRIHCWQKPLSADLALLTAIKFLNTMEEQGAEFYNPAEDIILSPYNKAFGTIELNKGVAQHLGIKRGAVVHEVIAGFQKHYLAIGDRVLYNKEDAFIENIARNDEYMGARTQTASKHLNRWGHLEEQMSEAEQELSLAEESEFELQAIENFLESSAAEIEDRVTAASHVITLRYACSDPDDPDAVIDLERATDINNLLGGYAITIHKAQGSEYAKVFLMLHQSQNAMISRELLYTAMTRAAKHLYILCEAGSIEKGIRSQRIKGNTLAEKAEYFKGKMDEYIAKTTANGADLASIAEKKSRVASAVLKAIANLNAHYPQKKQVLIEQVTYVDTGDAAGIAYMGENKVNINPLYLEWDESKVLLETVPHEVAHVFAYHWFSDTGHGTAWRQLCIEAGGTGSMYHDMGNAASVRTANKAVKQMMKAGMK